MHLPMRCSHARFLHLKILLALLKYQCLMIVVIFPGTILFYVIIVRVGIHFHYIFFCIRNSKEYLLFLLYDHFTITHVYAYVCVCVCVYIDSRLIDKDID